jgi:hypothetical protein
VKQGKTDDDGEFNKRSTLMLLVKKEKWKGYVVEDVTTL